MTGAAQEGEGIGGDQAVFLRDALGIAARVECRDQSDYITLA